MFKAVAESVVYDYYYPHARFVAEFNLHISIFNFVFEIWNRCDKLGGIDVITSFFWHSYPFYSRNKWLDTL